MAGSGRKVSGFHGPLSLGSDEDFAHSCDPCLTSGQHVEARRYCVNCQEYLCKNCFSYHQRSKALKDHQLLDQDDMNKHSPTTKQGDVCTEKCTEHKNELIKFFCPKHDSLGCDDCIIEHHKSCDIDYIPDKCADIGGSDEYWQVMMQLGQRVKEADDVIKLASNRDKEIESCYDNLIKEIAKFRKEINDRLDALQKKIQADAGRKKSTDKQTVQNVLQTCAGISSDISQIQSNLQDSKISKQDVYINIKKAKSKVKSAAVKRAVQALEGTNIQYGFECNQDMVTILSKEDMLGELKLSALLTFHGKKQTFENITHTCNINVKTKSGKTNCNITGCEVLYSDKLVLADNYNNKLKFVDTERKVVVEETSLDASPLDIAVLPQDQIVVTMPENKEVLIMTTAGNMSTVRKFPVQGQCKGICYNHGRLNVVCKDPSTVFIFDTLGNVQNTISLKDKLFKDPYCIMYKEESKLIYLITGEARSNSVAVYKHKDLMAPEEMFMFDDGSLLVCCYSGTIHSISEDLKQGQTKYTDVKYPSSICYSDDRDEIYIGCNLDQVKVLCLM